jgi:transposase
MKTYFIGADVDSKMTELAFELDGKIVRRRRVATSIVALREALDGVKGVKHLALEEGPMAAWLARNLRTAVEELVVCDPRRNRLIAADGDKDDPLDAGKLAELLRGRFLRAVHHNDDLERIALKQWVGLYHDRVREAVRQVNKIRGLGRRYLVRIPTRVLHQAALRPAWLGELKQAALAEQLSMLWLGYDAVVRQVKLARAQLRRAAAKVPIIGRWQEVPGVGLIRAVTFHAYLDTPWRFRSGKAVCKYCGIGLLRATSGTDRQGRPNVGQVRIPWACNRRLKDVSMGMAVSAIGQGDNGFARNYQRQVCHGLAPANARHNVARKMVTVLRAMWKADSRFDPRLIDGPE